MFAAGVVLLARSSPSSSAPRTRCSTSPCCATGPFVGVLLAGLLLTFAAFASFTYTSIWLQSVLGPVADRRPASPACRCRCRVRRLGGDRTVPARQPARPIIGGGLLFIGVGGLISGALVHGSASWPALIPGFVVIGIGVGLATPTLGSAAMSAVPVQRGGMAAGAVNTARQLGFAFGIAALGSVFATRAQGVLARPARAQRRRRGPGGRRRAGRPPIAATPHRGRPPPRRRSTVALHAAAGQRRAVARSWSRASSACCAGFAVLGPRPPEREQSPQPASARGSAGHPGRPDVEAGPALNRAEARSRRVCACRSAPDAAVYTRSRTISS